MSDKRKDEDGAQWFWSVLCIVQMRDELNDDCTIFLMRFENNIQRWNEVRNQEGEGRGGGTENVFSLSLRQKSEIHPFHKVALTLVVQ